LVLTDAVAEHAAVVAIVIDTPLYISHVTALVGDDRCRSPTRTRLIVVDADASIVTARAAASDWGRFEIRPCRDGLENGALRAGICSTLSVETGTAHGLGKIAMGFDANGESESLSDSPLHVDEKIGRIELFELKM
jgi:hypothetical protein